MKQLFLNKGRVLFHEVPEPTFDKNSILVKVYYSFISSGTELATINESEKSLLKKFTQNSSANVDKIVGAVKSDGIIGTLALIKNKLHNYSALGYSCSGQVIAVGQNVQKFKVGDYVACAGAGFANHAEVVTVPINLATKVSSLSNLKASSITTIGAIAMQGFRRANVRLGDKVCVLGLGLIGQITAQLCKLAGCEVIGVDLQQDRLDLAKKSGINFVLDAKNPITDQINFMTNHHGVDATIITAASSSGIVIDNAMAYTRRKGKVILVGDVNLDFDREQFYLKEIDFLISCSYGPGRYDSSYEKDGNDYPYSYVRWTENRNMQLFVDLVEAKKLNLEHVLKNEFEIDNVQGAYSYLKKKSGLGALLAFKQDISQSIIDNITEELEIGSYIDLDSGKCSQELVLRALKYKVPSGKINVGFVGVGGFAKVKLLPLASKNRKLKLHTFIDKNSANLLTVSSVYDVQKIGNRATKLLNDDDVNMVVIATPHKYHLDQSLEALKNGKAVFVEKPAAVNFEQFNRLKKFFKFNDNCFYSVDFNRSFAPFNLTIKEYLDERKNPVIINYRMNAGFIPSDHWVQDEQNGGRIIGEACHIFELFCFLTGAKPTSVSVLPVNSSDKDILAQDNFVATLLMSDGSCCSLTYSSFGSRDMEKERMEILFDGKSILMQDYKVLKGYGLPLSFNRTSKYPDKGHEALFSKFVNEAKKEGGVAPISIERIIDATKISLVVDKLARKNGGFEFFDK